MNEPKIVIVGAGSHFTLGLFGDFFRVNDLWGSELTLMDINSQRLEDMKRIIDRVISMKGVNLKVSATKSLDEALENADYVIVTIRAGGLEVFKDCLEIPLKMGVVEVVGDTTGPSGILKGIVEMPAVLDIACKIRDKAPEALMINFTNPMTPICRIIRKATGINIVGLCHGVGHMFARASKILRRPKESLDVYAAGINHLTWTVDVRCEGESIYNDLISNIISEENRKLLMNPSYLIGISLYQVFKILPTLDDRHTSEFFAYLYDWINHPVYGVLLKEESFYVDYENKTLSKKAENEEVSRELDLRRMAKGLKETSVTPSGEYALDIISAIENNKKIKIPAVNIPNNGAVNRISSDYVVEVPTEIEKHGLKPVRSFHLNKAVTSILNMHLNKFEVLVDGILEKSRDLIVQAISIDPLTPSPEKAEKIFDSFIQKYPELSSLIKP